MNGLRTCIVLGAGASRGYANGAGQMPLQWDIAAALLASSGISRDGDVVLGGFGSDHGLTYSFRLKAVMCAVFDLQWPGPSSLASFWQQLQDRGHTLESIYGELCARSTGRYSWVADEFMPIVLSKVSSTVNRGLPGVCASHRQLALNLEPADVIVNFNWDTLASDALYHHSKLWFPSTGFGLPAGTIPKYPADASRAASQVLLLHVHGSAALYSALDASGRERGALVYLPPETYNSASSMIEALRVEGEPNALRDMTGEESDRFGWGWVKLPRGGPWLRPVFVPPSSEKLEYQHWYHEAAIRALHSCLPWVDRVVVAGYSAPVADRGHLASMFPDAVLRGYDVVVVNPSNDDPAFRARIESVFPRASQFDYSVTDFASFCTEPFAKPRTASTPD